MRPKLAAALALALSLVAGGALADPGDAERALADARFREGREAMEKKRVEEACTKFDESLRLWERGGTALNLAACREAQGKVASAWTAYTRALSLAQKEARADREEIAKKKLAELTPDLSWLVIVVPPELDVPDLVVTRNGAPVSRGAWGVAIPVDPGRQAIVARAASVPPVEAVVDVGPHGDRRQVALPASAAAPRVLPTQPSFAGVPGGVFGGVVTMPQAPPPELGPNGVVRVHIDTRSPDVALFALDPSYGGMVELTRQVCVTPCDQVVDARQGQNFFFAGEGVPPSSKFRMNDRAGDVTARVAPGSGGLRGLGLAFITLGGTSAIVGAIFLPIGLATTPSTQQAAENKRLGISDGGSGTMTTIGGITLGVGGFVLLGGILLTVFNTTSYKLAPGSVAAPAKKAAWSPVAPTTLRF
ncbi:MAG TPA: tetratricopeptide repeat protein [Byssovorax sp.]|jgi:hypothetical protein